MLKKSHGIGESIKEYKVYDCVRISLFLAVFFIFFIAPLSDVSADKLINPNVNGPVMTDAQYVSFIKSFIAEGRPLDAGYEAWMDAHPQHFTQAEFADRLHWQGAVGGQTAWLQLGIGWYRDPYGSQGPTPIGQGEFNPYIYQYSSDIYAAYKQWRETGIQPPGNWNPGVTIPSSSGQAAAVKNNAAVGSSVKTLSGVNNSAYKSYQQAKEDSLQQQAATELCVSCQQYKDLQQAYKSYKNAISRTQSAGDQASAGALSKQIPNFSLTLSEFNNLFYRGSGTSGISGGGNGQVIADPYSNAMPGITRFNEDSGIESKIEQDFQNYFRTAKAGDTQAWAGGNLTMGENGVATYTDAWGRVVSFTANTPLADLYNNFQGIKDEWNKNYGVGAVKGTSAGTNNPAEDFQNFFKTATINEAVPFAGGTITLISEGRAVYVDALGRTTYFSSGTSLADIYNNVPGIRNAWDQQYGVGAISGTSPQGLYYPMLNDLGAYFANTKPGEKQEWAGGTLTMGQNGEAIYTDAWGKSVPIRQSTSAAYLAYLYETFPGIRAQWDKQYGMGIIPGTNRVTNQPSQAGVINDWNAYFQTAKPGDTRQWADGTLTMGENGVATYTEASSGRTASFNIHTSLTDMYSNYPGIRSAWDQQYGVGAVTGTNNPYYDYQNFFRNAKPGDTQQWGDATLTMGENGVATLTAPWRPADLNPSGEPLHVETVTAKTPLISLYNNFYGIREAVVAKYGDGAYLGVARQDQTWGNMDSPQTGQGTWVNPNARGVTPSAIYTRYDTFEDFQNSPDWQPFNEYRNYELPAVQNLYTTWGPSGGINRPTTAEDRILPNGKPKTIQNDFEYYFESTDQGESKTWAGGTLTMGPKGEATYVHPKYGTLSFNAATPLDTLLRFGFRQECRQNKCNYYKGPIQAYWEMFYY